MKFNLYRVFFTITFIVFLTSCYENTVIEVGKPLITDISKINIFRGEEITIYGNNLKEFPDSAKIYIDSFKVADVKSPQISKWNNSFITLKTDNFRTGNLFIIIDKDTTNKIHITIDTMLYINMISIDSVNSFEMGSNTGAEDEFPIHNVNLTKKLEVSVFEITQKLYSFVMNSNPSSQKGDSLPVVNISWENAIDFCNKYSILRNLKPCYSKDTSNNWQWANDSGGYRLPTEAEWEYFARAKSIGDYAGTGNLDDMGWYELNSGFNLHKVGLKAKNGFGLYDVHGNAREWCWDYYNMNYYGNPENNNNPTGPSSGKQHVSRGGSSSDAARFLRITNRSYKDTLADFQGFRIVRKIK